MNDNEQMNSELDAVQSKLNVDVKRIVKSYRLRIDSLMSKRDREIDALYVRCNMQRAEIKAKFARG